MKIRAFTLIELLMVLVMISVLVSIGLFSYLSGIDDFVAECSAGSSSIRCTVKAQ